MSKYFVPFNAPWGKGTLAADSTGLTDVLWGAENQRLTKRAPVWLQRLAEKVEAHLSGDHQSFQNIPIAWHLLTPFQRHVYQTLMQVPAGEVVTYGELAQRMGCPSAARAVANALGANCMPIIVPCHRVIRSDGGIGGFTAPGGVRLKRWLLKVEGVVLH